MSRSLSGRLVVTASLLATIGIVWSVSAARTAPPPVVVDQAKAAPINNAVHDEAACKCVCKACQAAKAGDEASLPHRIQPAPAVQKEQPGELNEEESKLRKEQYAEVIKELDARFAAIKPEAPVAIPTDPPPHEGARFELPYIIEAGDVLHIELLMGLPEQPLAGEFPVQQDGTINLGYYGSLHLQGFTISRAKETILARLRKNLTDFTLGLIKEDPETGEAFAIDPKNSMYFFIDVFDIKSKKYNVLGDVAFPGELPFTGNDYVLGAIQKSAGFITTADIDSIYLHRPARGKSPSRTYKIDYRAIEQGKVEANLQLFPGDRLVVGRLAEVQKRLERELKGELPLENPNLGRNPQPQGIIGKNKPVLFGSVKSLLDRFIAMRTHSTVTIEQMERENAEKRKTEERHASRLDRIEARSATILEYLERIGSR
jgi:protein involved in polysaccharide export with SLBB domain